MTQMLGGSRGLTLAGVVLLALVGVFLILILADDDPPAVAEEDLPAGCEPGLPHLTCTYTSSTRLRFDSMVNQIETATGKQVGASTPVWVQAWGGRGARGANYSNHSGSYGGYAGYAMTVSSVGALSGNTLNLYIGDGGSRHPNYSGQGGASTIVSTQLLSQSNTVPGGVLAVAGGSGGGGKVGELCFGERGGAGGVAIAGGQAASGRGGNGYGPTQGAGGNGGQGGAGGGTGTDGTKALGGYGGAGNSNGSSVGWVDINAVDAAAADWNAGAGGPGRGGGGGGGYGGGGGGGECAHVKGDSTDDYNGGGAGGGSWALGNAVSDSDAPTDSKQADGVGSKVVLTINVS